MGSSTTSRRAAAFTATCVALLLLAGCAGRSHGNLVPVAGTVPGASRVDLLVATTRSPDRAPPGELFTGERSRQLSFAAIDVSIPPDAGREIGEVQWARTPPGNPAKEFVALRAAIIDRSTALKEFHHRVAAAPRHQVLVFVHGYNNRFEEAVFRFAQIVHDSGSTATPVLFTWPSGGRLVDYVYDRESANYSRDALEGVLQALARDPAVGDVAIMAHSMGNWLALETLRQMAIRNGRVPPKISTVMLAAPDVDTDVFRTQIQAIGPKAPKFTLFVSQDDEALALSRRLSSKTRLGAIDPSREPYRDDLAAARINVVDLTKIDEGDMTNHSKFAESPEVVRLIGRRLATGQRITDGQLGLGERIGVVAGGAAATAGAAATLAVSTPLAVIDPETRERLGEHLEDVGSGASETLSSTGRLATGGK